MILSLIVWLAMQGQVQVPDLSRLDDPGIVRPLQQADDFVGDWCMQETRYSWQCVDSNGRTYKKTTPAPKPAEHVIEIKRRTNAPKHWQAIGPGFFTCEKKGTTPYRLAGKSGIDRVQCFGVTHELWIDGVRWCVVKGLD